ncbi:MAG: MtnX-like HAD-IB family phosphatase [bacterium]|nr:MtnX-like HAD-IB family phosphatase [bacterium]
MTPVVYLLDFDGTITTVDTLCFLLDKYGDPRWREFDHRVERGEATERESLVWQMDTLRIPFPDAIEEITHSIRLRDGVLEFFSWCADNNFPVRIVSGGYEELIQAYLQQWHLEVAVYANRFPGYTTSGGWQVESPPQRLQDCRYSCCKCVSLDWARETAKKTVYIGDGITDYCVASKCDHIYSLKDGALSRMLARDEIPTRHFVSFDEILQNEKQRLEF